MQFVSIIVPCYNEEKTIQFLLNALYHQTFPRERMEVIISDGLSTDRTRETITEFQNNHPGLSVKITDNPKRNIPSALNRALETAKGTIIVRLDAHSVPSNDYVARSVAALEAGHGENVGGVWKIHPQNDHWVARSIATAASHPLGVGDARYRYSNQAQLVDTVPFGAFHMKLISQIGPFDETLLTNEDYEFNVRIRHAGGRVWMDPKIHSVYFARSTFKALAQQYWRYGYWKAQMLRRYPNTIRWRQILPPLFTSSLLVLGLLSFLWPLARWVLGIEIAFYISVLLAAGIHSALKNKDFALILGVPIAIATMHLCWGSALLWGLIAKKL